MKDDFLIANWNKLTEDFTAVRFDFFQELIKLYGSKGRYYHNLNHIKTLLKLSGQYRSLLGSPQAVDFAIWYHDAIYQVLKQNNEEKSAELAKEHLLKMGVCGRVISDCFKLILGTKSHKLSDDLLTFDAKFLMDIDLLILAESREVYLQYVRNIRREYGVFPDLIFNRARKEVLRRFLTSERIFKTVIFYDLNEKKARENLAYELNSY